MGAGGGLAETRNGWGCVSEEVTAALLGAEIVAEPAAAAPGIRGQQDNRPKVPEGAAGGGGGRARRPRGKPGGAPAPEPQEFDPAAANGGGRGGKIKRRELPEGCPVTPLGTYNGMFFYLDAVGQLRDLKARDHGGKDLLALFAPRTDILYSTWPRMNADGDITGWRPELAAEELMNACAHAGVWNAMDKVRGRGAWQDESGGLILHVGDAVMMGGQWRATGQHGAHVYPAAPAVARPVDGRAGSAAIEELLTLLKSWRWKRPGLDPFLLLGWLACAKFGGALDWRPLAWVTGDKGTGKSTLHKLLEGLMGGAMLYSSDPSEAGIRQTLGNQTLPVMVDEAEPEADNRKLLLLVKLARQASSGGKIVRGGSDHNAQSFVARSCFLLSSILMPPLQGQDRSRMAVLELLPLPPGAAEPQLSADWMRNVGAVIGRRLLDGWVRWPATLAAYRAMLKEVGHGGRGADQFGTLLAAADLLISDTVPTLDAVRDMAGMLGADLLAETAHDESDGEKCLAHLLTSSVLLDGGARPQTVGWWIGRAAKELEPSTELEPDKKAEAALNVLGLRVHEDKKGAKWVAVAAAHQGLAKLFANSHWQSTSGAAGVWGQSLGRLPGALTQQTVRFGGKAMKCIRLPLALARDDGPEEVF